MGSCAESQSLSTAATVGFSVGGTVATELVLVLLVWAVQRYRLAARREKGPAVQVGAEEAGKAVAGLKSPTGSFMHRWLGGQARAMYSPVELAEVAEEAAKVGNASYPSRAPTARRQPPTTVPPVSLDVALKPSPAPPPLPAAPQPPAFLSFYSHGLAAAMASQASLAALEPLPPPSPTPLAPPPHPQRPTLAPLLIPAPNARRGASAPSRPRIQHRSARPPLPPIPPPSSPPPRSPLPPVPPLLAASSAPASSAPLPRQTQFRRFSRPPEAPKTPPFSGVRARMGGGKVPPLPVVPSVVVEGARA